MLRRTRLCDLHGCQPSRPAEWAGRLGQGANPPGRPTARAASLGRPAGAAVTAHSAARARAQDLAICVHGTTKVTPEQYLNTIPFMDAVREDFERSFSTARL